MKKLILASGLVVMVSLSSIAQDRKVEHQSHEQRATMMTEKMAEELGLSSEQKKQILEINMAHAKERNMGQQERKKAMEARKAEMEARKAEMKKKDDEIKAILTEAQRAKWEEIKQKQKDRDGKPGSQNGHRDEHRKRKGGGR